MWRFKPSKFKNAAPKVPKKGEGWILNIFVGSPQSHGNHIKASAAFMAFNIDSAGGGNLGVLPLEISARKSKKLPVLHAHAGMVTDFDFSPFDDGLLATCAEDHTVKLWHIPEEGLPETHRTNFSALDSQPEVILWHPTVDSLLTLASDKSIKVYDVTKQQQLYANCSHEDLVHSLSWKTDGSMLVSTGKDGILQIWDPRSTDITQETKAHLSNRDCRVVWLGDTEYILSTGFGPAKDREVALRDTRNFNKPLATSSLDSALNVFVPLFDPDTNMLFLTAKAENTLHYWEVNQKEPYFIEGTKYIGDVQAKGAALVPKRALHVMQAEVNRILMLGKDCVVPISYQVPRKSYRDYHSDLYCDTRGTEPALHLNDWIEGKNIKVNTISLDPHKNFGRSLLKFGHILNSAKHLEPHVHNETKEHTPDVEVSHLINSTSLSENKTIKVDEINIAESVTSVIDKPTVPPKPVSHNRFSVKSQIADFTSYSETEQNVTDDPLNQQLEELSFSSFVKEKANSLEQSQKGTLAQSSISVSPHRAPRTFGVRTAKFRHLNGTVLPKNTHITNICNLSKTVPGECNGFNANPKRVAFPMSIAGGHSAVLELTKPGRLPSNDTPNIVCGSAITDFCWDPFDSSRLVLGCDNGSVYISLIPKNGLEGQNSPNESLKAHSDKVSIVLFHPLARDILATASYDLSVKVWDLSTKQLCLTLKGHSDQILTMAWSPDGRYLATVSKDQKLRIYEPRSSSASISEGPGPSGKRGARIVWVFGGSHLVISGFSKVSERQISLYNSNDLSEPITTEGIDVNPSILIPFYDEGSSTLFLTGRGDSTIFAFEVSSDPPHFFPLSHYKCSGPHQAVSFLPKNICNVEEVEFARAIRLTNTSIEPLSFTVPRLRTEYFQDDLFPDARVTWEPVMSAEDWLSSANLCSKFINLKPNGMLPLSEAPQKVSAPPVLVPLQPTEKPIQYDGQLVLESSLAFLQGGKEKQERIISSMKGKMSFHDDELPQNAFEGVDPDEWDEDGQT